MPELDSAGPPSPLRNHDAASANGHEKRHTAGPARWGRSAGDAEADNGTIDITLARLWKVVIRLERSQAAQRELLDSLLTTFRDSPGAERGSQPRLDLIRTPRAGSAEQPPPTR